MSLAIRLARGGSKKRPYYRIVVADSRNPRWPLHRKGRHVQPVAGQGFARAREAGRRAHLALAGGRRAASDRVLRFLDAAGIRERTARNNPQKAEPGEKAKERVEELRPPKEAAMPRRRAVAAQQEEAEAVIADAVEEATAEPTRRKPRPKRLPSKPVAEEGSGRQRAADAPAEEPVAEEAAAEAEAGEEAPARKPRLRRAPAEKP